LKEQPERAAFRSRFKAVLDKIGLSGRADSASNSETADFDAQRKQRTYFDSFAENQSLSYHGYALQPFWRAVDEITFSRWSRRIRPGSHLLDLGCANGRSSFYWARRGVIVTGFDISKKLIRQAIETARAEGLGGGTTFFVGDGRHPPFKDESFDQVLTYGVLHHLPAPGSACREIQRVLVKGGTHFGSENNRSVYRGVFDALMKLMPLWHEEAGEEPLLSQRMLRAWTDELPVHIDTHTMVYLPPHLCNWLGDRVSRRLLRMTDGLGARIGPLREQGGLLVFEIQKG
jgi:SAM-dependent methyltransferase